VKELWRSCLRTSDSLDMIRDAAQQAAGVTRSLLTFSRKVPAEKKAVNVCEIVEKSAQMLRRMLPASIELTVDTQCNTPMMWINADATQLQQVVMNLAINARDAMPEGGRLHISVSPYERGVEHETGDVSNPMISYAKLVISDTGTGMSLEVRERIFEPFITTKPRGQGTGLGLSIIHGIVEDHGGCIHVDSEVGKGSTFTILLPCLGQFDKQIDDNKETKPSTGHYEYILLAEDNSYLAKTVARVLESLQYKVVLANDGPSLMECIDGYGNQLQLMLIDMDLPGRSGLDCLHELRTRNNLTPAIFITGSVEVDLEEKLDNKTVLLRKPFEMDVLAKLVANVLATKCDKVNYHTTTAPIKYPL